MKILSYDIESCTGSPNDASLCSFGYALADENFNIIKKEDIVVNPVPRFFRLGKWGEEPKIKLNYDEKTFRAAPRFSHYYDKIKNLFTTDAVVIGFAINNDVSYLNSACEYYGKEIIPFKYFDIQQILGFFDPENKNLGLKALGEKYEIEFTCHRSDEDAFVTLKLLKIVCERMNLTFQGLMKHYEIMLGVNGKIGAKKPIYLAEVYEKHGLKKSKTMSSILLYEFLEEIKKRPKSYIKTFRGKRFLFNQRLELEDINLSRRLINKIYQSGGIYTGDVTSVNSYVTSSDEKEDKRLKKLMALNANGQDIEIISETEFISSLGDIEEQEFDEVSYIITHEKVKQLAKLSKKE